MNLFLIIIAVIIVALCWLGVIPLRKWIYQLKAKYYGEYTRKKLKIIKFLEPIINYFK